ncbi:MAG: ATP-binding protein [Candidatus Scalindua sp.]
MSIRTKLLIFALSISLIPISIITTLYYFNARSTIEQQTLSWLTAIAESKKIHTLSLLDSKKGRVIDFSSDSFIRNSLEIISGRGAQSDAVSSLDTHLNINKKTLDDQITSIAVIDINGKVVASTTEEWIGMDMSNEDIFKSCVSKNNGESYTGKSYSVPYLNVDCIFISAPLTNKHDNKTIGVIINAYDIAILDEITANRAGMGESGEVLLGQKRGDKVVFLTTLKYAPGMPGRISVPLSSTGSEPMRLALNGQTGTIIASDYRGKDVVAAYLYIPDMDWGLVTKLDKKEVFLPITHLRIFTIILACINAIVVITIVIIVSKKVTRPIRELVNGTKKIASGDLDFKIPATSKDEIGLLASSFNEMTSQLGESNKRLEDYAENLKGMVAEKAEKIMVSERRYRLFFDTLQEGVYQCEPGFEGVFTLVNQVAAEMFGYKSPEEMIGTKVKDIYVDLEDRKRLLEKLYKDEIWRNFVSFCKKINGVRFYTERTSNVVRNEKGEVVYIEGIISDITERTRNEQERERLFLEVEYKNKEMEQIIYVTSHDLRSPLLNIQGFSRELQASLEQMVAILRESDVSDELRAKFAEPLDGDIPDALKFILTSSSKMDKLLSGLLRISRMGRASIKIQELEMNRHISEVIETYEYKIKIANVKIQIDELPPCRGDDLQINQIFSNLLDNALKYLDRNREGIIKISGKKEEGHSVYCVEDNGIGIAERHQKNVFEIFHRLQPDGNIEAGEGLGLTIVRRILDRHGGRIWVESEPGKGSRFYVSLPA